MKPEKLTSLHELNINKLNTKLAEDFQPLVESFCKKYQLSFDTGMGQYDFYFNYPRGNRKFSNDNDFLAQFDADLLKALDYKLDGVSELGLYIKDFIMPVESLVYIRDIGEGLSLVELTDYDEFVDIYNETDPEKVEFYDACFYKVSRVMATEILNNPNIDMGLWH